VPYDGPLVSFVAVTGCIFECPMRLVIDLQACQASSKLRGIGRYSLALAQSMARCRGDHEILIVLSNQFPETIAPIRAAFAGLLPASAIHVWASAGPIRSCEPGREVEREQARRAREVCLASLQPDFIHVASLFEGFYEDTVTETHRASLGIPVAVTLYDLIPLLYPKSYLNNPHLYQWYGKKLQDLRRADLCLCISEATQHDAIQHLRIPPAQLVNISADADPHFRIEQPPVDHGQQLRERLGLVRPFVMCTAGFEPRKGLPALIRAFALLPASVRQRHQLLVVCAMDRTLASKCQAFARREGLQPGELILSGYLPDAELVTLYNLCQLFVFPSQYEGFGLPVLEAMRCAAPVIAARNSSLCEIVVWDQALFDPADTQDMATLMAKALTEPEFRQSLVDNGTHQAARFSWETTAKKALHSIEQRLHELVQARQSRPRMAFVSPLPPERSGISDYSAQLLPALSRYYQVDVVVNQAEVNDDGNGRLYNVISIQDFLERHTQYERVVYQFGNSHFHSHMFDLLGQYPGVVVLHDFFLSGVASQLGSRPETPTFWVNALFHSHGYAATHEFFQGPSHEAIALKYPCSLSVIARGLGVIVHSKHATDLAAHWYGARAQDFSVIPLVRDTALNIQRKEARQALGVPDDAFLLCSFGHLSPIKLNHRLLDAWAQVIARRGPSKALLVFVGEISDPQHRKAFARQLNQLQLSKRVRLTGWTSPEKYQTFLAAADLCVQLRSQSRGESSAAALDCMNHGQATIINAHGSMVDIPASTVIQLPDEFTDDELVQAIIHMMDNPKQRAELGQRARAEIVSRHTPEHVAARYTEAIEQAYQRAAPPQRHRKPRLYIDISPLIQGALSPEQERLAQQRLLSVLMRPHFSHRVEPVYGSKLAGFRRAQRYTFGLLKIPLRGVDRPVAVLSGDAWMKI